jgi:hypothetical protein
MSPVEKNKLLIYLILSISLVAFLFMLIYFVHDARTLHKNGVLGVPIHRGQQQQPRYISEVNAIRPWMTFEYINASFSLPNTYLQSIATGTNKYPRVSILEVAKKQGKDIQIYLQEVQTMIQSYKPD